MNRLLFISILILIPGCSLFENEQNKIPGCEDSYDVVDSMPILIGGLAELQRQVKYPEEAKKRQVEGRVTIGFIVNEEGDPIQIRQIRGIGYGTFEASKEALLDAKFIPGSSNGKPVCVNYSLPIVFRLPN